MEREEQSESKQFLSVWDTVSILIGIVVGTSIFKAPPLVFGNVSDASTGLLVWGLGALISLCGALCYCELATTYPGFGGEYQYLSQAYGRRTGFLFAWMQLCVILTGSIGAMAFVFSDYSVTLAEGLKNHQAAVASSALVLLTLIHSSGLSAGKLVQNFLTVAKVIALGAILVVGCFYSAAPETAVAATANTESNIGLALVFVLYAYGGWNDAAMVTPEVRDHQRNMPKALLFGLGLTALLYLSLNVAFLKVLGFDGVRTSAIPAAEIVEIAFGRSASIVMSLIVMLSALGAIHGMLFVSCRLLAAVGDDYALFRRWSEWNNRGVPLISLLTITGISLFLVLAVGTEKGQLLTANTAVSIGLPKPDWAKYFGGFDTLVAATAPIFWAFFAMSGFAVSILRFTDRNRPRPFRVPFYPLPVIVFCFFSLFMLWKSLEYAKELTLLSLPVFVLGIILSMTRTTDSEGSNSTGTK